MKFFTLNICAHEDLSLLLGWALNENIRLKTTGNLPEDQRGVSCRTAYFKLGFCSCYVTYIKP